MGQVAEIRSTSCFFLSEGEIGAPTPVLTRALGRELAHPTQPRIAYVRCFLPKPRTRRKWRVSFCETRWRRRSGVSSLAALAISAVGSLKFRHPLSRHKTWPRFSGWQRSWSGEPLRNPIAFRRDRMGIAALHPSNSRFQCRQNALAISAARRTGWRNGSRPLRDTRLEIMHAKSIVENEAASVARLS